MIDLPSRQHPLLSAPAHARIGRVSLVGAGPGDPDLITVKGLRRLQAADAVVYDRLAPPALLDHAPGARLYNVGKRTGRHAWSQDKINALMVTLALEGLQVVRLKGGDPFVFGRGGEEALALAAAGVPCEIVPGVSAAIAAPAAAGIPVTHRGLAASVTIATGHGPGANDHDWPALARVPGTLVFMMAVEHLDLIVERLIANGRSAAEPAAVVHAATTPNQSSVTAPLGQIATAARRAGLRPPAVLVVGPTVDVALQIATAPALSDAAWPALDSLS